MTRLKLSKLRLGLRLGPAKVRSIATSLLLVSLPFFLTGCSLRQAFKPVSVADSVKQSANTDTAVDTDLGLLGVRERAVTDASNYLVVEPAALDTDIRTNSKLADTKSRLWKKDAKLIHFSAKFPPGLPIGQVTETFTYGSVADAYNWWTMTISGKTGKSVRALIPKEDYLGTSLEPVSSRFWKTNYLEALQQAEVYGGRDYRAIHPEAEVTVSLAIGQPNNYLWWTVEYSVTATTGFKILVNPATKEVFTEAGQPASSSTTVISPYPTTDASATN